VERCDRCGFEYDLDGAQRAAQAIVGGSAAVAAMVRHADAATVHIRSSPPRWSVLEYACHLRDVLLVQRERVLAARRFDTPSFDPMGRDERVEHDGYADQDPRDVARQLVDAASMLANALERLTPRDWHRSVMYNYPRRVERTLRWVAVHTEHEVRHHRLDIEEQLPFRSPAD
jgi:hypothetical protein